MAIDFDAPSTQVISPKKLAHVVLRTNKLQEMVEFYKTFLGAQAIYENNMLCFMTYDEEHHRLAILEVPETQNKIPTSCGLEHIAFSFDTLSELLQAYRQRRDCGIKPVWPVNHGPTTSIYYRDPDGNMIETQVDNFDTPDDATDFMRSKFFSENPIGTDFDPEDYITRLKNGATEAELKVRVEIGPRGLPNIA
ncbi:Glyoxalase/Bleomycin resistance protein/Dihydroxybiphenyl dioxygenase [Ilyonectria sp. MPI-CAGE-AT-0026]|nr:Glyoxalase/Bleomycin resistance protein/Dihydroxybiphenyl dioxygenase [Ilyonectria sp. MPI-CAGE-AT-0026]